MPEQDVVVHADDARLAGIITLPERTSALVLFAHGSGSSRLSPRNRYVATQLNEGGLGTLLFDLLTAKENLIDEQTHIPINQGLLTLNGMPLLWLKKRQSKRGARSLVIPNKQRAMPNETFFAATPTMLKEGPRPFFRPTALSVAYVDSLHCTPCTPSVSVKQGIGRKNRSRQGYPFSVNRP